MRAAFFFWATLGMGIAAPAQQLDIQVQTKPDGSAKLVLRNVHQAATQAYSVRMKCAAPAVTRTRTTGQPTLEAWRLNPELPHASVSPEALRALACAVGAFREADAVLTGPRNQIGPNETAEFPIPQGALVAQIGVIYADGAQGGDSEALGEIQSVRAAVRTSIPFAEAAVRNLAAASTDLPHAIETVKGWRNTVTSGGFARLVPEDSFPTSETWPKGMGAASAVLAGRITLLNRILEALQTKDSEQRQMSLSTAIDRAIGSAREMDAALAGSLP